MDREIEHVFEVLSIWRRALALTGKPASELQVLELGPGSDFGAQLLIASQGARVTVADRFLSRWESSYHPEFYRRVAQLHDGPNSELEAVLRAGTYDASTLVLLEEPAERMPSVRSNSMDLVCSFAVLEHITDLRAVAAELARVTKVEGSGLHTIDLRYHRDFSRPIEHLIWSDGRYRKAAEAVDYEFGNRWRSLEFWAEFEAAGFGVREIETHEKLKEPYRSEALERLRASGSSYWAWPESDLERVVVTFSLRLGEPSDYQSSIDHGRDNLVLHATLKSIPNSNGSERDDQHGAARADLEGSAFHHQEGHLFTISPEWLPHGDSSSSPFSSELLLFEDDQELGPPHTSHEDIRRRGLGKFSHWGNDLYVSTSDNSDPSTNGRKYSVRF